MLVEEKYVYTCTGGCRGGDRGVKEHLHNRKMIVTKIDS